MQMIYQVYMTETIQIFEPFLKLGGNDDLPDDLLRSAGLDWHALQLGERSSDDPDIITGVLCHYFLVPFDS